MATQLKKLPKSAFQFLAPAQVSAPNSEELAPTERQLTGIAYSGGLVTDHGYWSNLVIDLGSVTLNAPIPLLSCHDHDETIGIVTSGTTEAGNLSITARLFADVDDEAAEIAAKADKGFPWQLSVGIWPSSIEEVLPGQDVILNGQSFTGPLIVFRNGNVREVSVVSIGADNKTSATVLEAGNEIEIPIITYEDPMTIEELKAKVAQLEAELAQEKVKNVELSAAKPNPAEYAPIAALQAAQTELAALKAEAIEREVNALVETGLNDGRLLAAHKEWATELGKTNLAALNAFLEKAQPIPALQGTQTGGHNQNNSNNQVTLSAEEQAVSAQLGLKSEDFIKHREAA